MNTCAVCDGYTKLSIRLPQFAPDEKLAFVERVCGLLIESRFSHGRADAWVQKLCSDVGLDLIAIEKPRFVMPETADSSAAGSPAEPVDETRASPLLNCVKLWDALISVITASKLARGSPRWNDPSLFTSYR